MARLVGSNQQEYSVDSAAISKTPGEGFFHVAFTSGTSVDSNFLRLRTYSYSFEVPLMSILDFIHLFLGAYGAPMDSPPVFINAGGN